MKTTHTKLLPVFFAFLFVLASPAFTQTVIFSEDFETGSPKAGWETYYPHEDTLAAVPIAQAPKPLSGGGNYVGRLQDLNGTYSGSAVAVRGLLSLQDYSIEADVYVYVNQSLSAYTGLVVYADSSRKDFYKLRADFDASNRVNFSGLKADPNTFLPLFSKDFSGANNPGLFPTVDGWHKLKVEVRGTSSSQTTIWGYLDGVLLNGAPVFDTSSTRVTSGKFGLYSFQSDSDGIAAYFDNIIVKTLPAAAVSEPAAARVPEGFALGRNYPNPFNPSTTITYRLASSDFVSLIVYDQLGREVRQLVSQSQSAGEHVATWDGQDASHRSVSSGVYVYRLQSGSALLSDKMLLMK